MGIGKASVQHKPSIKERLEANKTHIENREQKKPSSTPMPPQKGKDMDVHGMLEHYKAEAEKHNAELKKEDRQSKPGYDRDGPSR